jgi:phosphoglycerate dehydrogenase-like enzyme
MLIYKVTNTLDGYLPLLDYTNNKAQAEVMVVGGKPIVLSDFPKLRGIFKTGVGTDNLPFDEAAGRGIEIALPSATTCDVIYEETAAYTGHLILTGLYAGSGDWDTWRKVDRPQLAGRRLLVVGTGRIGQRVADKMAAFLQVDTYDTARDAPDCFEAKVRAVDGLTLHVPLTAETRNLFDAERLAWLRDGALLVNTARGPVIDEDALYTEVAAGRLRAAIDVFWQEPYRGRLTELPADRFIRSPHIASTCKEFVQGTANDFLAFMARLDQR